jgi:hypothetical protein
VIDLAYASLTQEGDDAYVVGPVSDSPGSGYLWHYWLPWLALLDRKHLRLRRLDRVLTEGCPFVFPLEFRWECMKWMKRFARSNPTGFLTPHIPPAVLKAARVGRAIILLFFGHEGRSMTLSKPGGEQRQTAYDLIFEFVDRNELPAGAVWFISGNLGGQPEYLSWKRRRLGGENAPDPFEARFIEPFSHLAQTTCREDARGFKVSVRWEATRHADRTHSHQCTHLARHSTMPNASDVVAHPARPTNAPPKLFLCMNRIPRPHRRTIVCHLLRRGFLGRSLVSFHDDDPDHTHFDELEMESAWQELQKLQPLNIDCDLPLDFEGYHRTNAAAVRSGELWPYRDTCFSIVTETLFGNDVLFVSEKLWKPIRNGHPFLVAGTPATLAYLRRLGFQTFMPTIDERYDVLVNDEERMQALFDAIDALGALNDKQCGALLENVQPLLDHNAHHLRQFRSPMASLLSEIDARLSVG